MTIKQLCYNPNTRVVYSQTDENAIPAGFTKLPDYIHDAAGDKLGPAINHVLFHHVRDALYTQGITDVAYVSILIPTLAPTLAPTVAPTEIPTVAPVFNPLGTAANFSIFGNTVTVSAPTTANLFVGGNSAALVGNPIGSERHFNNAVSMQASADIISAINYYNGLVPTMFLTGDLVGQTLVSGVYFAAAAIGNSGILTFDAQENINATWVIRVNAAMGVAASSSHVLTGGAQAKNITWVAGGAITAGAAAHLTGNFLSSAGIGFGANVYLLGRVLTTAGAITIASSTITTIN